MVSMSDVIRDALDPEAVDDPSRDVSVPMEQVVDLHKGVQMTGLGGDDEAAPASPAPRTKAGESPPDVERTTHRHRDEFRLQELGEKTDHVRNRMPPPTRG